MSSPLANDPFIEGTHKEIPGLRFRWRPQQAPGLIEVEVVGQGIQLDAIHAPDLVAAKPTREAFSQVLERLRMDGMLPLAP
jgi:hypothetical protein